MKKEKFLALAEQRYDALRSLNQVGNFYDYEKQFVKLWQELGRDVLEKNIGVVPMDRRKKNLTTLGTEIGLKTAFPKRYQSLTFIMPVSTYMPLRRTFLPMKKSKRNGATASYPWYWKVRLIL